MLRIAITIILAMHINATATQNNSKGDVPSNSSINQRVDDLRWWSSVWNKWSLGFIALTAVAAVGYLVSSRFSLHTADSLDKARVEQLNEEFAHRDERIAQVKAEADIQIAQVKADADAQIAAANRRSEEISARANRDAAELTRKNLETESSLEAERKERDELEKSISPRWITKLETGDLDPLRKFAGVHVVINAPTDSEPQLAATQLANVLTAVGWKVEGVKTLLGGGVNPFDGVNISPTDWLLNLHTGQLDPKAARERAERWQRMQKPFEKANAASLALADFLKANDWTFSKGVNWVDAPATPDVPDARITITVGIKPNPRLLPEKIRLALEQQTRITDKILRTEKKLQKEEEDRQ